MPDICVTFAIDPDAESCGDVLPLLAALLIEIDARKNQQTEIDNQAATA